MATIASAHDYEQWLIKTLPDNCSTWWTFERWARRAQAQAIIDSLRVEYEYEDGGRQYESWKEEGARLAAESPMNAATTAAPDVLEALQAAHSILIQRIDYQKGEWCPKIEAAIAKAKGSAK